MFLPHFENDTFVILLGRFERKGELQPDQTTCNETLHSDCCSCNCLLLTVSSVLSCFFCRSNQQTPVSEDTTGLFGPPLETAFGEHKTEGNPLCLCLYRLFEYVSVDALLSKYVSSMMKNTQTHTCCLCEASS